MERFFHRLIALCCWLRIVAAMLLLGLAVGAALFAVVGDTLGIVLWIGASVLGLVGGVAWARRIARRDELVAYAGGVHVPRSTPPDRRAP